jgi:hypothetical protein
MIEKKWNIFVFRHKKWNKVNSAPLSKPEAIEIEKYCYRLPLVDCHHVIALTINQNPSIYIYNYNNLKE